MALATRPKPKVQHKKRVAQHHRHNKRYLKTYWPYLPMVAIVLMGLAINSVWSSRSVLGVQRDFSSSSLLGATNEQRTGKQESPLTLDSQLAAAAQAKANDMASKNYWSHTSPNGDTPWTFITNAGYQYEAAGENLAYGFGNADETVKAWMSSPEHRANILSDQYQNVGFGVAQAENFQGRGQQTIIVAEYGRPVPAVANISFTVPSTNANTAAPKVAGAHQEIAARPVSRVEVLAGSNANWLIVAIAALSGAAAALFLTRHSVRLHKTWVRGERFIIRHPWLDITIVFVVTVGGLLTRSSGIIR